MACAVVTVASGRCVNNPGWLGSPNLLDVRVILCFLSAFVETKRLASRLRFLLRVPRERTGTMTFNASRGSHRRAVHPHATLPPCTFALHRSFGPQAASAFLSVRSKLDAAVSWTVGLLSSLFENGLGEEFPLTPWLRLAIAVSSRLLLFYPAVCLQSDPHQTRQANRRSS